MQLFWGTLTSEIIQLWKLFYNYDQKIMSDDVSLTHSIRLVSLKRGWWYEIGLLETDIEIHCVKSVRIWSFSGLYSSRIRTEYGEILRISPYSVRMRENTYQKNSNTDTFHAVDIVLKNIYIIIERF